MMTLNEFKPEKNALLPSHVVSASPAKMPQVFTKPADAKAPFLTGMIVRHFGQKLINRSLPTPYFHLKDYMQRFWLIQPKSKRGIKLSGPLQGLRDFGVRVHCILRSDRDAALHDHPWWNVSLILKGCYWEVIPLNGKSPYRIPKHAVLIEDPDHEPAYAVFRPEGSLIVRGPKTRHRLIVNLDDLKGEPGVWTLFITLGKGKGSDWGFYVPEPGNSRITRWKIWWDYIGLNPDAADPGPGGLIKCRPGDDQHKTGPSA